MNFSPFSSLAFHFVATISLTEVCEPCYGHRQKHWKGTEPERHKPEGSNVGGEEKAHRGERLAHCEREDLTWDGKMPSMFQGIIYI